MDTHPASRSSLRRVFYGYWIVAFTFLCLTICIGCGSFVYSLFVKPLQEAMDWSRGQIMVGFTIFFLLMGVASPFVGRMVDAFGARRVVPLGALVMGLGFVLLSTVDHLPLFYVGYMLVGSGAAGIGVVPCSALVSNWFKKKRGLAIGLMSSGIGAGGVVMAPVAGYLLDAVGWRGTYLALAVIVWVAIIPLALLVVSTRPEDIGLNPDGAAEHPAELSAKRRGKGAGIPLKVAMGTAAFWLISVSFFASNFSSMGGLQSQGPNLIDLGFPASTAALALGIIGFGSGVGKFIFGWLCDRMPPKWACVIGLSIQVCGVLVVLGVTRDSSMATIWCYALLMGFGSGSWLPTVSLLTSGSFGLKHYGSVFGVINLLLNIGTATGPLAGGMVFDATGTYRWAFILFAALYAVALPSVALVRRPRATTHS